MKVMKTMTAIELFKAAGAAHGMATQTQFISSAIGDDQYGITSWRLEN